jgi:hypothetical protein
VEGVLWKLTDDTTTIMPSPSDTGVPMPTAFLNAADPAIPQEVQTLLLEETATVTDLSMHDPLGFDSDESAFFGNFANTFTSPARESTERPAPATLATILTPTETPTVCPVGHNSTATINQLKAQVPHDTQWATEQAIKKHNATLKRNYNNQVKNGARSRAWT